jgi:hypothetical protein
LVLREGCRFSYHPVRIAEDFLLRPGRLFLQNIGRIARDFGESGESGPETTKNVAFG